ncbi:MAG: hypothetical protein K2P14_05425 [Anaeroplasmataceae bacterium]|nr:hypothetical protein [Anaeroplasmataceae bacterium]
MYVLVLKTSADATMQKLLNELCNDTNKQIDCLIQSSQVIRYQKEYPDINFIDICKERFENLPSDVTSMVTNKKYDQLYITLSGVNAYNFWNVMELVNKIRYKTAFFYNCNGVKMKIPRKNIIKDTLCKWYINWLRRIYG